MTPVYPTKDELDQVDEPTMRNHVAMLELLVEQARTALDAYESANEHLENRGWQLITFTSAIIAIAVPSYLQIAAAASDAGRASGHWIVLSALVVAVGLFCVASLIPQVRPRTVQTIDFGMDTRRGADLLRETIEDQHYAVVLTQLLFAYTGSTIDPTSRSAIGEAKAENTFRAENMSVSIAVFAALIATVTVGTFAAAVLF